MTTIIIFNARACDRAIFSNSSNFAVSISCMPSSLVYEPLVICNFFKTQPYIPSRKAVYVVEHVEKELRKWGKKKSISKRKEKKLSAPGLEPVSPKVPRIGKGSSIAYCNKMADTMLNCLTCCSSAFAERFGIKANFSL